MFHLWRKVQDFGIGMSSGSADWLSQSRDIFCTNFMHLYLNYHQFLFHKYITVLFGVIIRTSISIGKLLSVVVSCLFIIHIRGGPGTSI